jgi:ABC-type amino acid transport substrate-binding protein
MRLRALTVPALIALTLCGVATAAAATLDRVKTTGTIRIGYRADAPPHSFLDASGHPTGYVVDVCTDVTNDIGRALGLAKIRVDYVRVTGENRFTAVRDGQVDLLCEASSMTMTRRELVDFSLPTFVDGAGVLSRDAMIVSFEDLAGKRVGVLAGTTTETVLRSALKALSVEADIRVVEDHRKGAAMVTHGELDAYVADRSILTMMLARHEEARGLKLSPRYFSYETYGLAMEKGDSAFRLQVDRTIARLARTGRLEKMLAKAFGAEPDDTLRVLIALDAVPD